MRRMLAPTRPDPLALGLLTVAAIGVLVAGTQHGRLFHRGYAEVEVVGLLFLMNAIGSLVVVLALVLDRVWVFLLGALSICVPSLVSIAISHSSVGFLGFREGGYDPDAMVIVVAEVAAAVFALVGAAIAVRGRAGTASAPGAARVPLVVVVVVAMGCAIVGVGMGSSPAQGEPAPSAEAVAAARQRIAGGASVRRGRELFADQGCDRCHSVAAIDAQGKLGPRLDTLDEDLEHNLASIANPREKITDGYPVKLMPADFARRLDRSELRALAAFVTAASAGEQADDQRSGRGGGGAISGHDRGRGGDGGGGSGGSRGSRGSGGSGGG
jgi:mono/diheme cytochrome c family protein